jgi:hypothetical protein
MVFVGTIDHMLSEVVSIVKRCSDENYGHMVVRYLKGEKMEMGGDDGRG